MLNFIEDVKVNARSGFAGKVFLCVALYVLALLGGIAFSYENSLAVVVVLAIFGWSGFKLFDVVRKKQFGQIQSRHYAIVMTIIFGFFNLAQTIGAVLAGIIYTISVGGDSKSLENIEKNPGYMTLTNLFTLIIAVVLGIYVMKAIFGLRLNLKKAYSLDKKHYIILAILLQVVVMMIMLIVTVVFTVFSDATGVGKSVLETEQDLGLLTNPSRLETLLSLSYVALLVPIVEEFVFRGMLFATLVETKTVIRAIVYSSVFFGLLHILPSQNGLPNYLAAIYTGVLGAVTSKLTSSSNSLIPATVLHSLNNAISYISLIRGNK